MTVIYRVECSSSIATQAVNVWHFQGPDSDRVTEANACITALDAFYESIKAYLIAGTITAGSRVLTEGLTPNVEIGATSLTTVTTGSGMDILAQCVVAKLRSANVGGRYHGRKYLGPLASLGVDSDGKTINSSCRTDVISGLTTLMGFSTAGVDLGVYSRTFNTFTPTTIVSANTIVGIQRRRLR